MSISHDEYRDVFSDSINAACDDEYLSGYEAGQRSRDAEVARLEAELREARAHDVRPTYEQRMAAVQN